MPKSVLARLAAPALLASTAALTGCIGGYYPGGSQASRDLFTYPSTVDTPQTIKLMNSVTGQQLWVVDIPIGKQMVIWFYDNQKTGDPNNPSIMRWELMDLGETGGDLDNAMPVPGPGVRRVDVFRRTSPLETPGKPGEPIINPTPPTLPPPEPTNNPT
jgi:hypothetical protein